MFTLWVTEEAHCPQFPFYWPPAPFETHLGLFPSATVSGLCKNMNVKAWKQTRGKGQQDGWVPMSYKLSPT